MSNQRSPMYPIAAYISCLVVMGMSLHQLRGSGDFLEATVFQITLLVTLGAVASERTLEYHYKRAKFALVLMLLFIFVLSWRVEVDYFFIYSIIWISIAVHYFSTRQSWFFLLAITFVWYLVRAYLWGQEHALEATLLVATFHVFALMSSMAALRSMQANLKTQELNRQLLATQHLLSEASKDSERNRIARDLHDLLGHHLTALSINLQVAERLSSGQVKDKVAQCYSLTKLLLNDVRDTVSTLRVAPLVNLKELLSLAIKDIPRLNIQLEIDQDLSLDDVNAAEAILRCVQEAITNSLRHSKANRMTIAVSRSAGVVKVCIKDNGQGQPKLVIGNGLTGMRERIERLGGELNLQSHGSFKIDFEVPVGSEL